MISLQTFFYKTLTCADILVTFVTNYFQIVNQHMSFIMIPLYKSYVERMQIKGHEQYLRRKTLIKDNISTNGIKIGAYHEGM